MRTIVVISNDIQIRGTQSLSFFQEVIPKIPELFDRPTTTNSFPFVGNYPGLSNTGLQTVGEREYSNRNVYDIIADILTLCKTPIKKTPLRNRVSASEKLLTFCVREAELLEAVMGEDAAIMYRTSTKGLHYLQIYDALRQIMRYRMPLETIFESNNAST